MDSAIFYRWNSVWKNKNCLLNEEDVRSASMKGDNTLSNMIKT